MLQEITPRQFMEWKFYEDVEPWEEIRADFRAAHIVSTLVNIYRDRKKNPNAFPIKDFLLKFDQRDRPKQTPMQVRGLLKAITAAFVNIEGKKI